MLDINSVIINCFATEPDRKGISSGIYRKTATPCCDDVIIHTRPSAGRKLFTSRSLFLWTTKALPSPLYTILTLRGHPSSLPSHPNLTPTLFITYISHRPWWGVGVKLTYNWVFPPQDILYYSLWCHFSYYSNPPTPQTPTTPTPPASPLPQRFFLKNIFL